MLIAKIVKMPLFFWHLSFLSIEMEAQRLGDRSASAVREDKEALARRTTVKMKLSTLRFVHRLLK